MCFSAEASFTAAAVLVPVGIATLYGAYTRKPRYLAIAALPLFFGVQQLFEGLVWIGNDFSSPDVVDRYSRRTCSSRGWRGPYGCPSPRIS